MSGRRPRGWPLCLVLVLAACGADDGASRPERRTEAADASEEVQGTLTVLAAASLTDAFAEIASLFEAEHDDVRVDLSVDGSAKLATAIIEGAPADLFASADEASLAMVADEDGLAGAATVVATNVLQIVVPAGNPRGIGSLADLVETDVTLSLCGPEVPCGRYAAAAFEAAGLSVPPSGTQENVKGVLTQVQLGEADAGIAYLTDVRAAQSVEGIDLAEDEQVIATYPASVLAGAANPAAADAFLVFLTRDEAQAILRELGFGPP